MSTDDPTTSLASRPGDDFASCWRRLPDKLFFLVLLAAWLALFQFLGNSTFGYVDTPSLLGWMYNSYNSPSPTSDDGHGNLIPFVVLALFWCKRRELLAQPLRTWWPGGLWVAGALALHVVGYMVQQPRISILALFAGLYGLMGLVWGRAWLRASFFPFFLLAFCIPFGSLTEPITFPLRILVCRLVEFISHHVLAIDVVREGTRLFDSMHQYEYDVAVPCSGMRSLIAVFVLALVYAFLVFRTPGKRLVMMAAAFPFAVLGNLIRMLVIVIAAELGGQTWGNDVHENWFFSLMPYVPAIFGLMWLGSALEKRGRAKGEGRA